jgi:hypothetical protein
MADGGRVKGPYVPLAVGYRDNDRVLGVEPLAELLFVRGLAFAKEKFQDGFIGRRQVITFSHDIAHQYMVDPDDLVSQLVDVGLWSSVEGGWLIEGWTDWNTIESSRAGKLGNHVRWHERKGVVEPSCEHCSTGRLGATSPPNRGDDRGESQSVQISSEKTPSPADAEGEFDEWYRGFPRKEDRGHAVTAFKKARKLASLADLIAGLERSKAQWDRESRPKEKIPYPATWLNGKRWLDEYTDTAAYEDDVPLGAE